MKNDVSRRYRTRVITNIIYSAIISCLVEVFFVTNLSMVARYMGNKGKMVLMVQAIEKQHTAVVLLYLILGILLFSITFMILQEPYIRYISKISDAVQNISEGNLNTVIDVIGDDEFSGMAANLNRMAADIKQLMEKERESERTKNELITNVAHDLRTPLTSIIGYLDEAEGVGIISAGGYCKYIEFGTGVKGRDNSHPSEEYKAIMNWAYNSGATIFTTKDGREGWYYPADDGTWRFTEGMPSRPFMYETAQYLRKEAQKIASEVFKDG